MSDTRISPFAQFFGYTQMGNVRELSAKPTPVYAWQTGGATAIIRLFAPEKYSGMGNVKGRALAQLQAGGGDDLLDIVHGVCLFSAVWCEQLADAMVLQMFRNTTGEVISLPGIPPMYDWEFFPQAVSKLLSYPIIRGLIGNLVHRRTSRSWALLSS